MAQIQHSLSRGTRMTKPGSVQYVTGTGYRTGERWRSACDVQLCVVVPSNFFLQRCMETDSNI